MTGDPLLFRKLTLEVENAIENYHYAVPQNAVGNAWVQGRIESALAIMRNSLIDPYWIDIEIRDTITDIESANPQHRTCVAVADDSKGRVLAWEPDAKTYLLGMRTGTGIVSIGVYGDAVGCFLSI